MAPVRLIAAANFRIVRSVLRESPWRAIAVVQQVIRRPWTGDRLSLRIPFDPLAHGEGDVAEMREGGGAVADLDVGIGRLAGLHTIQEVPHVILLAVSIRGA